MKLCAALLAAAFGLTACGGGDAAPTAATSTQPGPAQAAPPPDEPDPELLAPKRVPRSGDRPADPASARVIRAWARALRSGQVERAARFFAIPSRFQNVTEVLSIDTAVERLAVNLSLPCGAVPERMRGARGGFTIVTFRLTARRGGECAASAIGERTGGAIRVAGGRIREWYRLYDSDDTLPPPPEPDLGTEEA